MNEYSTLETNGDFVDTSCELVLQLAEFSIAERLTIREVVGMHNAGVIQCVQGLSGRTLLFAHGATREQALQLYATIPTAQVA